MKLLILTTALAFATPAVAQGGASRLAPAFGATVVSTYPDGRTALLWLNKDGTYTAKGRRRTPSSGTWTLKDDKVCLGQIKPIRAPFKFCTALPSGASWKAKAVTGEPITVKITPGTAGR
jgi:hypothetical protein